MVREQNEKIKQVKKVETKAKAIERKQRVSEKVDKIIMIENENVREPSRKKGNKNQRDARV